MKKMKKMKERKSDTPPHTTGEVPSSLPHSRDDVYTPYASRVHLSETLFVRSLPKLSPTERVDLVSRIERNIVPCLLPAYRIGAHGFYASMVDNLRSPYASQAYDVLERATRSGHALSCSSSINMLFARVARHDPVTVAEADAVFKKLYDIVAAPAADDI